MRILSMLVLAAMARDVSYRSPAPLPELCLEIESFKLIGAEIKPMEGAGGGKVAVFLHEGSRAETTVLLGRGAYEVTIFMAAEDDEHDAVYIKVADAAERRVFPTLHRTILALETFTIDVPKTGRYPVAFRAAETNVMLDKIVLKRKEPK